MAMGVSGEAGELLDAIKKCAIYEKEIDVVNVTEELGDLEFYMEGLRNALGITRENTLAANMKKLAQRYVNYEYTNARANERVDKSQTSNT
jgi:NTP pyrophosphatase (non-canonical NTP hydrolase)